MPFLELSVGERVYYELIDGELEKPWLVFLHEGLGCVEMWKGFPRLLCERTGCPGLVYDRQGYGKSSAQEGVRTKYYLHDAARRELPEILGKVLPGREYILIGHSDGASIALIYAAESARKGSPLGVVSEAAHVFVEPETIRGVAEVDSRFDREGPGRLEYYHPGSSHRVFKAWSSIWLSDEFRSWNVEDLLAGITCPVLVIQGEDDAYATEKQVDAIVSRVSGKAEKRMIPACGHTPHLEKGAYVLELVAGFIAARQLPR